MSEFIYEFVQGDGPLALLMLHGTGADERDLLPLGNAILPGAPMLSPRGQSFEEGVNRFFRRHGEGVFDEEDIIAKAAELAEFVREKREAFGLKHLISVGYSNGANIGTALLQLNPDVLDGHVGLRGQSVLPSAFPSLVGKSVLTINGEKDPIVSVAEVLKLHEQLKNSGATFEGRWLPAGHGLGPQDIEIVSDWLGSLASQISLV